VRRRPEGDGDDWSPLTSSHGFQLRVSFHSPVAIGRLVPPTHDLLGRHWAVIVLLQSERETNKSAEGQLVRHRLVSSVPLGSLVSLNFVRH